jgi:hypothetical protein
VIFLNGAGLTLERPPSNVSLCVWIEFPRPGVNPSPVQVWTLRQSGRSKTGGRLVCCRDDAQVLPADRPSAPGWRSLACRSSVKAGADEKNSFAVNRLTHIGTELAILFITRSTWVMLRHLEGRRRQNSFSSVKGGSDDGSWIDPNFPWFQKDDWSDSENASSRASADNQPNFEFARTVEERNVSNAAPIGRVAKGDRRQQLMAATGGSTSRLSDACNPNDAVFGDRRVTPVFRGVPSLLADPAVEPISGAFRAVLAVWTG